MRRTQKAVSHSVEDEGGESKGSAVGDGVCWGSSSGNQTEGDDDVVCESTTNREGRLRLELAEANRRVQRAKKGRVKAEKVRKHVYVEPRK